MMIQQKRTCHKVMALALCLVLSALLAGCGSPPPPPSGNPMQVAWGETVYRLECARCHNPGRSGPALTEQRLSNYADAQALFEYIRQNMPLDKPGALPEQDYWDVTGYLLATLHMLPGPVAVGPDNAASIDFEY